MSVETNLNYILSSIPRQVNLVAVSKTKQNSLILKAYDAGQRVFGENKVQELVKKSDELPKDISWQMIGHLQRNKVKFIASFISLIHTVDSIKLLKEIDKRAKQNNRVIDCLLQVHIATENTKFGFDCCEVEEIITMSKIFQNIKIIGLMGMATFTNNKKQITEEFKSLNNIFKKIRNKEITTLSMGMSNDYHIAIEQGSNMIRVGSAIFGNRN